MAVRAKACEKGGGVWSSERNPPWLESIHPFPCEPVWPGGEAFGSLEDWSEFDSPSVFTRFVVNRFGLVVRHLALWQTGSSSIPHRFSPLSL